MRGRVGASCLSSCGDDWSGLHNPGESRGNQDRHKAPTSTPPFPLSLQKRRHLPCIFHHSQVHSNQRLLARLTHGETPSEPPHRGNNTIATPDTKDTCVTCDT